METTIRTLDADASAPGFAAIYLREDSSECAFIETYTAHATPIALAGLRAAGRRPEDVRYIVVTHAHLDHAGGASALMQACPNATLLAHPRAARHLVDPTRLVESATRVYGAKRFTELYGTISPIPAERVRTLGDGESFALGESTLRVWHTRGHAKHHMIVHDPRAGAVFTGDTFGLVYPSVQRGGLFALPSTSPTDFEPAEALASIDRVLGLDCRAAYLTHYGEVRELAGVASQLRAWLDRADRWLTQAVERDETMEETTRWLTGEWRSALAETFERRHVAFDGALAASLAIDIDLNAQGIAFVAHRRRSGEAANAS